MMRPLTRVLAAASDRTRIFTPGSSDEVCEMLVAAIADSAILADLDARSVMSLSGSRVPPPMHGSSGLPVYEAPAV